MTPPTAAWCFPFLGCFIGWLSNRLAVTMLFKPRRPVRLLGLEFQGIIPKRKADMARRLAEAITRDMLSSRDIALLLSRMDWEEEIRHLLEKEIEQDLKGSSLNRFPVFGALADNLLSHVRSFLTREIAGRMERHREAIAERIHSRVDVRSLVLERVGSLDLEYIEAKLQSLVRRELATIEILGGALGFMLGSLPLIAEALL